MFKKIFVALLVAGGLIGAVYGAAASTAVTAPNIGAGDANIGTCAASGTVVDYTATYVPANSRYELTTVTLTAAGCGIEDASIALTGTGTLSPAVEFGPLGMNGSGSVSFNVSPGLAVSDLQDIHVLIDG